MELNSAMLLKGSTWKWQLNILATNHTHKKSTTYTHRGHRQPTFHANFPNQRLWTHTHSFLEQSAQYNCWHRTFLCSTQHITIVPLSGISLGAHFDYLARKKKWKNLLDFTTTRWSYPQRRLIRETEFLNFESISFPVKQVLQQSRPWILMSSTRNV